MKFSERLMNLRKSKGMSQEDLAEKLNVTRQTVSKWESDRTTPDMNKLIEMSRLFAISLDELTNNVETATYENTYKETPVEKNNRKIATRILILGAAIGIILCGIGLITQAVAKKTDEQSRNDAYALALENYNDAMERVEDIDDELEDLNEQKDILETELYSITMEDNNWASERKRLHDEIFDLDGEIWELELERLQLINADYTGYYPLVKPITYLIFYYIAAGTFVLLALTSLIYYLATRRKK